MGKHHRILSKMLMDIEQGNKDRICVNIPPRHDEVAVKYLFTFQRGSWVGTRIRK